ncbi:YigZ family protein [Methylophilaceae bacterium]|nr:YigZ family protein [Methylophilaceae bacterium]
MLIITSEGKSELVINKSKFIGYSIISRSRKQFLDRVGEIKKNNPSSSHTVFGLRIKKNIIEPHFSDDGEPSGTAGRPLIKILETKKIINSGLAVVRYYGGINLGMGGLARAYSQAGIDALINSKIAIFINYNKYKILIEYNKLNKLINVIYKNKGKIYEKIFKEKVEVLISLPIGAEKQIKEEFKMIDITLVE